MPRFCVWQNWRVLRLALAAIFGLALLVGLLLGMDLLHSPGITLAEGPMIRYVAPAPVGNDSDNDCTGSSAPCATIQRAVDVADAGDEVRVATGVYTDIHARPRADVVATGVVTQIVYVSKTVTLRGGYTTANWLTSDPRANPTTLDAQRTGRALYVTGHVSPAIEGLELTGGSAASLGGYEFDGRLYDVGGGVYVITATATLSTCRVTDSFAGASGGGVYLAFSKATLDGNTISDNAIDGPGGGGAGLDLYQSVVTLEGNTIRANTNAGTGSGGLLVGMSRVTLRGNTIVDNTGPGGGGLHLFESDATLDGNILLSNTAFIGGGLALDGGQITLTNNVLAANHSSWRGALFLGRGTAALIHNTFARNTGGDGSGIYVTNWRPGSRGSIALTNTILVSHTTGITVTEGNTATLEATLWGTGTWANVADWGGAGTILTGTINLWGDPAFVDPELGDYHIISSSAAIDAGVDVGVTLDIDKDLRPALGGYDLGADEFGYWFYLPPVLHKSN
jgi:hypothetical protein